MLNIHDVLTFIVLERKYGKVLENYNEKRSNRWIKECIERNNDALKLMKMSQYAILQSLKKESKTQKDYEILRKMKISYDNYLADMTKMSEILEIAVTPRPDEEAKWKVDGETNEHSD